VEKAVVIFVDDPALGPVIAKAAGYVINDRTDHTLARVVNGELVGGVVFEGWNGRSMAMHCAGLKPNWLNRNLLAMAFDYPFRQLLCSKVFLQVSSGNPKALEFVLNLGFKEVARLEDAFVDGDCIIVEMKRDVCRWLNLKPKLIIKGTDHG
jgi:RimJ/RimL family protein N-acetyltransferase